MFVYYNTTTNRLEITATKFVESSMSEIMNTGGNNTDLALASCKLFCLGYMMGGQAKQNGWSVLNDITEFNT